MSTGWKFSRSSTDEGRSGGNPSEYTFDHDLKDFVRETLQNSNDAGQDRADPTEVTYKLRELVGGDARDFLDSIGWNPDPDAPGEALREHVRTVAEENTEASLGHVYREIEEDDRLVLVTVEDRNTHGLYGPEGGGGPFSALVLDELITQKEGSGAGGSYGLGKAVLWSWSGLKTVLFTSTPEGADQEPPRLIARSQLPTHEAAADDYRFEGHGLFGNFDESDSATVVATDDDVVYKWGDSGGRPYSIWGDTASAIAEDLGVTRTTDETGTSITVIGFCEPGGSEQTQPVDLAGEIADEASKWFWPAMLRGDLEVTVETEDREMEVEPDTCDDVKPFIRCVQNRNSTRDILDQPGDVGLATPTFEIEDKSESSLDEGEDPETESGPIHVYARLADPDTGNSLTNRVALIRGSGMVVKYYDRSRVVYGGRTFHGVVLAGEARPWIDGDPSEADEDIDDYLKAAEPPRHNDWEHTKNLKSAYQGGTGTTVRSLQRDLVTGAIKDLIRQTREEGRLVAGRLADRLNIPEGRGEGTDGPGEDGGGGGTQVFGGTSELSYESSNSRWKFSGFARVLADDYEAWEAEIALQQLDEEGNVVGTVPIDYVEGKMDELYVDDSGDEVTVRGRSDVEKFSFEGYSESDAFRGETQISVKGQIFVGRLDA